MRIQFLCASLEPGKDGVGDYVIRLAEQLCLSGHECQCVAINDRHVIPKTTGFNRCKVSDACEVIRLSSQQSWSERMRHLQMITCSFAPNWISLQFVPYGYQKRGFSFGLGQRLSEIAGSASRHMFFHELFIGMNSGASTSHRIQGFIQQLAIRNVIRRGRPDLIHTHVPLYQHWLRRFGAKADLLPLVSGIPIAADGPITELFDKWREDRQQSPGQYLFGGYFGSFYQNAANSEFIAGLHALARNTKKRVVVFRAGHQAREYEKLWDKVTQADQLHGENAITWVDVGHLSAPLVSRYLQALDFGIAATPWPLIGKSGSVAAMVDHGLPVLVSRGDSYSGDASGSQTVRPELLVQAWQKGAWTTGDWLNTRMSPSDSAPAIATKLADSLAALDMTQGVAT